MGLLDRLTLFESTLRLAAFDIKKSDNYSVQAAFDRENRLKLQFVRWAVIGPHGEKKMAFGNIENLPKLNGQETSKIGSGRAYIKVVETAKPHSVNIWMAVNLAKKQAEADILIAELNPELLWDAENQAPNNLWVFSGNGNLLFASEPNITIPSQEKLRLSKTSSGELAWDSGFGNYLGAYWKLPGNVVFASPELTIVQAQPESLAFSSIEQFSAIYPPVIALAVLIVAYLSFMLIAKNLKPLERLKTATQRISEGNFHYRLDIASRDEFEVLADSFNEMTRRLQNQFEILSTMAEIDRHILSSLNAEDIIDTALTRLPSILRCDLISIARLDPETYQISDIRIRQGERDLEAISRVVKLSMQDVLELLAMKNSVIETAIDDKFSAFLQNMRVFGQWRFLIVPIVVNGGLTSIICLGYQTTNNISQELADAARNFGDRIAVALSNAAWEEKLYQQAHFDALTGLPNRLVLNDRLHQEIIRAKRDSSLLAVVFIDLDRFKNVNDSLGHLAGDELLVKVSEILLGCTSIRCC